MKHLQGLLRFLPIAAVAAFVSGCAVTPGPESYVPTETVLVGYIDMERLARNPQIETATRIIEDSTGEDLWQSESLAQFGLTPDDLKHRMYVFITDWETEAGGLVLITENGTAQDIFDRVSLAVADWDDVLAGTIDDKAALGIDDDILIAAGPDVLLLLSDVDPEEILSHTGANPALKQLQAPEILAACQFVPSEFDLQEELEGLQSGIIIVSETNGDYAIHAKATMESVEVAVKQLEKLRGGLMLLNLMAAQNPEAGALFKQTRVNREENVIVLDVTDAGSAISAILKAQAEGDPEWIDIDDIEFPEEAGE